MIKRVYCPGVRSEMETPVPIPNTAVKHLSADDSCPLWVAKVGRCQDNVLVEGLLPQGSFLLYSPPAGVCLPVGREG